MFNDVKKTTILQPQHQQVEQRKALVKIFHAEVETINKAANAISNSASVMDKQKCIEIIKQSLNSIERILQVSESEGSLFLRNTIKPIRSWYEQLLKLENVILKENKLVVVVPPIPENMIPVYISLFQAEGLNLAKWSMQVRSLAAYVQGRPIYSDQDQVLKLIRSKIDDSYDAYVVVAVKPEKIINSASRLDKQGNQLLTLQDHAIESKNIIEFVHQGKHYCFIENQLILQNQ